MEVGIGQLEPDAETVLVTDGEGHGHEDAHEVPSAVENHEAFAAHPNAASALLAGEIEDVIGHPQRDLALES